MPKRPDKDSQLDPDSAFDWSGWQSPGELEPPPRRSSRFGKLILFLMAGGALIIVTLIKEGAGLIKDFRGEPELTATLMQVVQPTETQLPASTLTPTLLPPTATFTLPASPSPLPPATLTPPVEGVIAITITSPGDETLIACQKDRPCRFSMQGVSSGVYQDNSLVIWTLIYPVDPVGQGWYLQRTAAPSSSGEWEQPVNFLGEVGRVQHGSVFSLVAIVATSDATYRGVRLEDLGGAAVPDLRLIEGLVAQSDPLTVRAEVVE